MEGLISFNRRYIETLDEQFLSTVESLYIGHPQGPKQMALIEGFQILSLFAKTIYQKKLLDKLKQNWWRESSMWEFKTWGKLVYVIYLMYVWCTLHNKVIIFVLQLFLAIIDSEGKIN